MHDRAVPASRAKLDLKATKESRLSFRMFWQEGHLATKATEVNTDELDQSDLPVYVDRQANQDFPVSLARKATRANSASPVLTALPEHLVFPEFLARRAHPSKESPVVTDPTELKESPAIPDLKAKKEKKVLIYFHIFSSG